MAITPDFCTAAPEWIKNELQELGPVDILVGIPSFKEADNIGYVVEQCSLALRGRFPSHRSVILNVDNHSPDNTRAAFLSAQHGVPLLYISTPEGVLGKGNNLFNLFNAALLLGARAVVTVDADLKSIEPRWIQRLASPILENHCDFVGPLYLRNEYDGTITNHICYPLIYALLGRDLRQPIGGDFAISAGLTRHLLGQEWAESARHYGIDIFLTLQAVLGNFKLGQAALGAKIHKPSAPKLGPMFTQVVSTLFALLASNKQLWFEKNGARPVPLFGDDSPATPQELAVDYKTIKKTVIGQYQSSRSSLADYLTTDNFNKVEEIIGNGRMRVGSRLWTRIVYDLLYSFDYSSDYSSRESAVVESLKPLFFARVASFFRSTLDLDHQACEDRIRSQAREFRKSRRYLKSKYEMMDGK